MKVSSSVWLGVCLCLAELLLLSEISYAVERKSRPTARVTAGTSRRVVVGGVNRRETRETIRIDTDYAALLMLSGIDYATARLPAQILEAELDGDTKKEWIRLGADQKGARVRDFLRWCQNGGKRAGARTSLSASNTSQVAAIVRAADGMSGRAATLQTNSYGSNSTTLPAGGMGHVGAGSGTAVFTIDAGGGGPTPSDPPASSGPVLQLLR